MRGDTLFMIDKHVNDSFFCSDKDRLDLKKNSATAEMLENNSQFTFAELSTFFLCFLLLLAHPLC
jgi:hypothetical protein